MRALRQSLEIAQAHGLRYSEKSSTQPMDATAQEFLQAACDWYAQRIKAVRIMFWVGLGGACCMAILAAVLLKAKSWQLHGIAIGVLGMFLFFTLWTPIMRWSLKRDQRKFKQDLDGGVLACFGGPFKHSLVGSKSDPGFGILVGGQKVFVPYRLARTLPKLGQGEFRWFPNSRICWMQDGVCLWQRGSGHQFWGHFDIVWWRTRD
jgi:hypothetical protein